MNTPLEMSVPRHHAGFSLMELLIVMALIAILAGILTPSLRSAREAARRLSCMSNLSQMGKALAGYTGDYGLYFPQWAAWGAFLRAGAWEGNDRPVAATDRGEYRDRALGRGGLIYTAVPYNSYANYAAHMFGRMCPVFHFRAVYTGSRDLLGASLAMSPAKPGTLNMAPVNLGVLQAAGYLSDARIFFCPSSDGMPADGTYYVNQPINETSPMEGVNRGKAATRIDDLRTAGGFGAQNMLRGDWSWLPTWCRYTGANQRAVLGHYGYRLAPTAYYCDGEKAWKADLPYVRPRQTVRAGEPVFKSVRLLGGRAVASDAFTKYAAAIDATPGMGYWGHGNGYNVLYGDGGVRWHEDRMQRVVYWPKLDSNHNRARQLGTGFNVLCDYDRARDEWGDPLPSARKRGAAYLWHLQDRRAGLDAE